MKIVIRHQSEFGEVAQADPDVLTHVGRWVIGHIGRPELTLFSFDRDAFGLGWLGWSTGKLVQKNLAGLSGIVRGQVRTRGM